MAESLDQNNPRNAWDLYTTIYNIVEGSSSSSEEKDLQYRKIIHFLKVASTPRGYEILKWMLDKQVFSRLVLGTKLHLKENHLISLLRGLDENGLITIIGVLNTLGRKSPVYLFDGGDRSRIPDAVREHQFLNKDATPVSLEYAAMEAVCEEIVTEALARVQEDPKYVKTKSIPRLLFHELFPKRGIKVVPFGRIKSILSKRGWRLETQ